jgi:hypothetical protein
MQAAAYRLRRIDSLYRCGSVFHEWTDKEAEPQRTTPLLLMQFENSSLKKHRAGMTYRFVFLAQMYSLTKSFRVANLFCTSAICALVFASVCYAKVGDHKVLPDPIPSVVNQELKQRFLQEAPRAWTEIDRQISGFEVSLQYNDSSQGAKELYQKSYKWLYSVRSNPDFKLESSDGGSGITATNDRYSFAVARTGQDPFYVRECVPWQRGAKQPLPAYVHACDGAFANMHSIWWLGFDSIFANKDFAMVGIESLSEEGGEDLVRVIYKYGGQPDPSNPLLCPNAVYWADLAPSKSWVAMHSGVTNFSDRAGSFRLLVTSTYQAWFKKTPFPAEVLIQYEDPKTNLITEEKQTRLDAPVLSERPKDEFYLPYYDISEATVPGIARSSFFWNRRVGIVFSGIVCMVLAWLVYRKSNKATPIP